jgi:hypothetical protein
VRAAVALPAVFFQLAVRTRVALRALAFHPAVRAPTAMLAVAFYLVVRAPLFLITHDRLPRLARHEVRRAREETGVEKVVALRPKSRRETAG